MPSAKAAALLLAAAISLAAQPGLTEETTDPGELVFNNTCRTCHTTKPGDNRLGPNLAHIIGRKAGSEANYAYSQSMKDAGFAWDEQKLDQFIENPDKVVPNNNMKPFTGVGSKDDRAKIIAFLKTQ